MSLRDFLQQSVSEPTQRAEPVPTKKKVRVATPTSTYVPPEKNYYFISKNEPEKLQELIEILHSVERFAFDFETTTADPLSMKEQQAIVGISFSWKKGTACYLPIGHKTYGANWKPEVLVKFKDLFEGDKLKIAHNAKFETHWLKKMGINLTMPIFDPLLGVNLMREKYPELGLKPLVDQVFNYSMLTYEEITGTVQEWTGEYYKSGAKKGQKKYTTRQRTFDEVPVDVRCLEYTCADSDWALQLTDVVMEDLKKEGLYDLCTTLDIPLMLCLVDLERNGFHTDPERFAELKALAEQKIAQLEAELMEEIRRQLRLPDDGSEIIVPVGKTHKPLNLNSGDHLAWLLFDQLQLPIISRTDSGKPSTNAETLEKLEKKVNIPLFGLLMELKRYQKLESTYLAGKREGTGYIPHIRENNRIHSTIDQIFVSTGRFSSSAPNMQNCFDGDTEILTEKGWLYFSELPRGARVAQWDNGVITFVEPLAYIKQYYSGDMVSLKKTHVDLCVTPDHRCLLKHRKTGEYYVVPAERYHPDSHQLHAGHFGFGTKKLSLPEVILLCATQADGYYRDSGIEFGFYKERKIERLRWALDAGGIPYSDNPRILPGREGRRLRVLAGECVEKIKTHLGEEKSWGNWLLEFDRETIDLILEEVWQWGGCFTRKNHYSSSDKKSADWIQILLTLSGKRARLREYWNRNPNSVTNYQIDVTDRNYSGTANIKKDHIPHEGFVYCVEVPSSYIVIRRNGCTAITGNCPRAGNDVLGIRGCFIAPPAERALVGEDSLYLFCDYSQIELRVFAWYAQEPAMLDAFHRGQDLHGRTAWEMYNLGREPFEIDGILHDPIEVHEVSSKAPVYRQYAKAINFGIIYGLTAQGLANDLWLDTSDESIRRGQALLTRYLSTYTQVETQQKKFIAEARRNGYAQTMFGRRRVLPDITAHNKFKRSLAERQAMNAPVQGSASEIIKMSMVRIHQQAPPWLKMIMQIHDELVFEVPARRIIEGAQIVKSLMEVPIAGFDVPIVAEPEIALRWGQGFELVDGTVKIKNPENHEEFIRRAKLGGVKCL